MERVNDCISLSIQPDPSIQRSLCQIHDESDHICLQFNLYSNDCLFDLNEQHYRLNLSISKSYFDKYGERLEIYNEQQDICCNTQSKLFEIIQCKLEGLHRKLFLESSVLFLLYQTQKNSLVFQMGCDGCQVINRFMDRDKLVKAKEFILNNLSQNITIPIIANSIGTNQCYLKKGFKEHYGQTIFEFIQEHRMIKARYLLQQNYSISEVAEQVGYSSLSSFSQAYKSYFGYSPSEHLRNFVSNN